MKSIKLLFVVVASAFASSVAAQNYANVQKGDILLDVDYSMGTFTDIHVGDYYFDDILQNAISIRGEVGIIDNMIKGKGCVAIGGQVGIGFGSDKDVLDINCTRIRIATRGAFHYQFIPQLDTYAGFTFCFVDINKVKFEDALNNEEDDTDTEFIEPRFFTGARYMFCNSFGVNVELAADTFQFLSFGMTFRL